MSAEILVPHKKNSVDVKKSAKNEAKNRSFKILWGTLAKIKTQVEKNTACVERLTAIVGDLELKFVAENQMNTLKNSRTFWHFMKSFAKRINAMSHKTSCLDMSFSFLVKHPTNLQ